MKKYFLLFAILCGMSAIYAQDNQVNKNAPQITFDDRFITPEGIIYDYGTIEKDSDGLCYFVFTNTGKEPLIIEKASSSCGCTVPNPPQYPILPGQRDSISVKYSTNRVGPINKTVTIMSNAQNSNIMMRIKGQVADNSTTPNEVGIVPKQ
ncbi:MAG: DUF1573 domain-containing protein [Bacteroidales bacterium]|jgi:hypothetical protein|nr:DUF1573 domain-containing protein [Bacteroidales bacterium]